MIYFAINAKYCVSVCNQKQYYKENTCVLKETLKHTNTSIPQICQKITETHKKQQKTGFYANIIFTLFGLNSRRILFFFAGNRMKRKKLL